MNWNTGKERDASARVCCIILSYIIAMRCLKLLTCRARLACEMGVCPRTASRRWIGSLVKKRLFLAFALLLFGHWSVNIGILQSLTMHVGQYMWHLPEKQIVQKSVSKAPFQNVIYFFKNWMFEAGHYMLAQSASPLHLFPVRSIHLLYQHRLFVMFTLSLFA